MKVAFQMDPIGSVDIDADSTFRLAEEAQARGCSMWHYTPDGLSFREGQVVARAQPLRVQRVRGDHAQFGDTVDLDLADVDVVWLRQDPPFDMGYITTTHILDRLKGETLVVNDPFWVRNSPEKAAGPRFPRPYAAHHHRPRHRVLHEFKAEHGDIILKPLYGNGGAGVFRLDPNDRNLASLHELFTG
jgi:glutathione synthase